ncbi:50S ribosomal protein P1 [Candidatus Woesearchaeota archaeon]|nr:50S ribosomal protein P1 [Candidatus Woesearchaeota archaeon]
MEYVYAAMLLHKAKKEITEDAVKKILNAASIEVNDAKIKALVAALEGVNIEEAIKKQAVAAAPVVSAAPVTQAKEKKEEKKEEKKDDGAGAAGLGALFG